MSPRSAQIAKLVVLALIYLACTAVVIHRHVRSASGEERTDRVTLRIGHWLVHTGMREAFDEAIREYERLHPDVKVEQIAVPIRAYQSWVRTRLIGGNAPDITGMLGLGEEQILRHFVPLGEHLEKPNPYNAGTPLDGVPWRNTFVDGLTNVAATTPTAGTVYGVNLQVNTLRLYYNRTLLKEVTGLDAPPEDWASLRALADDVDAYSRRTGTRIAAIASCGPYATHLFNLLLPSQTQRLLHELSPLRTLRLNSPDYAVHFLQGRVNFDTPGLRGALELMQDATALLPPGFLQLQRDDALFTFTQGRSLMLYAGTWDYGLLATQAPFETGIAFMPLPTRDDPRFGGNVLGPVSEGANPEATLGIPRSTPHFERALDLLRFLSSRGIAETFSRMSYRMSSVVGTELPGGITQLKPRFEGEVNGFFVDFQHFGVNTAYTVIQRHLHLGIGPEGDPAALAAVLNRELPRALRQDLEKHLIALEADVQRLDAHVVLHHLMPAGVPGRQQETDIAEHQHVREVERLFMEPVLAEAEAFR